MRNLLVLIFFILCFNLQAGHRSNTYTASESMTVTGAMVVNTSSASITVDTTFSQRVALGSTLSLTGIVTDTATKDYYLTVNEANEVILAPPAGGGAGGSYLPLTGGTVSGDSTFSQRLSVSASLSLPNIATTTLSSVLGLDSNNNVVAASSVAASPSIQRLKLRANAGANLGAGSYANTHYFDTVVEDEGSGFFEYITNSSSGSIVTFTATAYVTGYSTINNDEGSDTVCAVRNAAGNAACSSQNAFDRLGSAHINNGDPNDCQIDDIFYPGDTLSILSTNLRTCGSNCSFLNFIVTAQEFIYAN